MASLEGKEHLVTLLRAFWVVMFTFEISVNSYAEGGAIYNSFPFLSKWALWLTYLTQLVALFATNTPQPESAALSKTYKNHPLFAWKWYTILF